MDSRVRVWAVHLLTASGAALALAAAQAASQEAWQLVFLCLGLALFVDGIDGPIARALNVAERLPWFDGATLDFVIDYTTYVFIPAVVLAGSGILSEPFATGAGIVIAVVGALYFADKRMKTGDSGFRGFPAVWNLVVFLIMIYRPSEAATLVTILFFAILTFTPIEFVHPVRVKRFRPLTLAFTAAWAVLAIWSVAANLDPNIWIKIVFGVTSFYLAVIGAVLQFTRPRRAAPQTPYPEM